MASSLSQKRMSHYGNTTKNKYNKGLPVLKYPVLLIWLQGSKAVSKSSLLHILYGSSDGVEKSWCCGLSLFITPSRSIKEIMRNQFSLSKTYVSDFSLNLISSITCQGSGVSGYGRSKAQDLTLLSPFLDLP